MATVLSQMNRFMFSCHSSRCFLSFLCLLEYNNVPSLIYTHEFWRQVYRQQHQMLVPRFKQTTERSVNFESVIVATKKPTFLLRISALASKKRLNQKLYYNNYAGTTKLDGLHSEHLC